MEPAAIRYKNPGAMWPGAIATKWGSKKWVYLNDGTGQGGNGMGNKIAIFDNWVDGICAQLDLWRTSDKYRNKRFDQAIATWSGGNHVESYIQYVLKRVPGMRRETVMNDEFWRGPMAIPFLKAQSQHEAGKPIPAADADWLKAQRRVMGGINPVNKTSAAVVVATTVGTAATGLNQGWATSTWVIIGCITVAIVVAYLIFKRKS